MAAAPKAQELVAIAHDAEIASDGWVAAQTGLADLEASRNKAMLAMADLDRLLIAAELDGGARDAIAQTHASVELLVSQEDAVLEGLIAQLQSRTGI